MSHLLAPYHQPRCVRSLVARLSPENYLQNATRRQSVTTHDDTDRKGMDWSAISSNVIATVLGGLLIGLAGGILYLAWQVPRSQDQILYNQKEMKNTLDDIIGRLARVEANDRRQDADMIRQESHR